MKRDTVVASVTLDTLLIKKKQLQANLMGVSTTGGLIEIKFNDTVTRGANNN